MDIVPAGRVITSNFFQTSSYTQKIYCYFDQVEHAGITYELPPCTDTCEECIDPNITEASFQNEALQRHIMISFRKLMKGKCR